jgi:hypothetical protein
MSVRVEVEGVAGNAVSLRKALWAFVCVGSVFLLLWFLRFFGILGGEFDILVWLTSTVGFVLFGVAMGVAISEKRVQVGGSIVFFILFSVGFLAAPFVGVGVLMLAEALAVSGVVLGVVFGGSVVVYLLLYMGFWIWLNKRRARRFEERNL